MARTKSVTQPKFFNVVTADAGGSSLLTTSMSEAETIAWRSNHADEPAVIIGDDGREYRLVNHPTLEPVERGEQHPVEKPKRKYIRKPKAGTIANNSPAGEKLRAELDGKANGKASEATS